eukprot:Gb_16055 [translate_table: standard]
MEKEGDNQICKSFLQWGNRKRMRCVKVQVKAEMDTTAGLMKKTTIRVDRRVVRADKEVIACSEDHHLVKPVIGTIDKTVTQSNLHLSSSPEKSDRFPPLNIVGTRSNNTDETNNKISPDAETMHDKTSNLEDFVWPKFIISLSRNEKEEDFMVMKGSKLPLRPKKRAKLIQRTIHSVSPGGWLCDLSQERYEVREKKCMKKRPRGLKAMGSIQSDSE